MKTISNVLLSVISLLMISCGSGASDKVSDADNVSLESQNESQDNQPISKEYPKDSFAYFLQHFPRKNGVYYWNGEQKYQYGESLDIDVSENQQCADAIIRLHAEWLWSQKRYNDIHYNLTNGFRMDYPKWAEGWRVKVNGNNTQWYKAKDEADYSYKNFRDYLEFVFMYAGTASLDKELDPIGDREIEVGDVFILPGHPGHAVIVVDKEVWPNHQNGDDYRLEFAQSYIPAQTPEMISDVRYYPTLISKIKKPDFNGWMRIYSPSAEELDCDGCPDQSQYQITYFIDHYEFHNSNIKSFKQH